MILKLLIALFVSIIYKKITMKLFKGLLVIAIISLFAVSCNETKKDLEKGTQENVEIVKHAANDAVEEADKTANEVATDVEKVIDSAKTMAEGKAKKCESKCSKDGKTCDGSCKA